MAEQLDNYPGEDALSLALYDKLKRTEAVAQAAHGTGVLARQCRGLLIEDVTKMVGALMLMDVILRDKDSDTRKNVIVRLGIVSEE